MEESGRTGVSRKRRRLLNGPGDSFSSQCSKRFALFSRPLSVVRVRRRFFRVDLRERPWAARSRSALPSSAPIPATSPSIEIALTSRASSRNQSSRKERQRVADPAGSGNGYGERDHHHSDLDRNRPGRQRYPWSLHPARRGLKRRYGTSRPYRDRRTALKRHKRTLRWKLGRFRGARTGEPLPNHA